MSKLFSKKILFVGGKGGVGKSTSAAALSFVLSQQGKDTLLVSTDPAHNIGHIFHRKIGDQKMKTDQHLWAMEIDPNRASERYIESVKNHLQGVVPSTRIDEVHRQIDLAKASPGAAESALFDRMTSIVLEEGNHFDNIIFDTAPTGHTVRLLSLPEMMNVWIDGMLDRRKQTQERYSRLLNDGEPVEDPIFQTLQERRDKFARVRDVLSDTSQTGFIFVLIPERLSILETEQAMQPLTEHGFSIEALIVNKVLPEHADGHFLNQRKKREEAYLRQIDRTFRRQKRVQIPLFENDIAELEALHQFSDYFRTPETR